MTNLKENPYTPATKEAAKLRMALMGASSSGKTWTALLIAERLCELEGGKIAFLDTEGRSARLYADRFSFDVYDLSKHYEPQRYITGIQKAEEFGYTVIVIDSFSHAWSGRGGVLDIVDAAGQKMGGNKFAGWSVGRPAHNDLVDTIINSNIHIIGTMRSKTEWVLETDLKTGKTKPVKMGLAAVQSADFEYEFDIVMQLDMAHSMTVSKSRCHSLQSDSSFTDAAHVATTLHNWLTDGEVTTPTDVPSFEPATVGGNGAAESDAVGDAVIVEHDEAGDNDTSSTEVAENQNSEPSKLERVWNDQHISTLFDCDFDTWKSEYVAKHGYPDQVEALFTMADSDKFIAGTIFLHQCEKRFGYDIDRARTILGVFSLNVYLNTKGNTLETAWLDIQRHFNTGEHSESKADNNAPPEAAAEPAAPPEFKANGSGARKANTAWKQRTNAQKKIDLSNEKFNEKAIAMLKNNAGLTASALRDKVYEELEVTPDEKPVSDGSGVSAAWELVVADHPDISDRPTKQNFSSKALLLLREFPFTSAEVLRDKVLEQLAVDALDNTG